ncbi:MAG: N-acetylmuramoyl-L-alanine amidase [Clostridia bacterium]|nr:N-acetylmuramoyl-L-alanine amidase [Clostridia bacterium]
MTRKNSLFLLFFISVSVMAACAVSHHALPAFTGAAPVTIVLDAGHGAPDGGAVGVSGTEEKDINLDIVFKLREILTARGVNVILTRDSDSGIYDSSAETIHEKKVSDMKNRLDIINNSNTKLVISIHMNSFNDRSAHGLHVFYARNHPEAEAVAVSVQESIAALTGADTHTVKAASDTLYLMKAPIPPIILVECGFLSNPDEEALLNTEEYRAKIAFAIANAVFEQLSN